MAGRSLNFPALVENFLDLFYPPRCLVCDKPGAYVHPHCRSQMPFLVEPLCHGCGVPLRFDSTDKFMLRCNSPICSLSESARALDRVASTFAHTGGARQAALRLKYKGGAGLSKWLGVEMAQAARKQGLESLDCVLPVPLHQKRLRKRGYNQSALLARAVGRELGMPYLEKRLVRQRYTRSQVGLGAAQRAHNVADAFAWHGPSWKGQTLLLIDDVCTTGATINACAKTLKAAGAGRVLALTLTREYT